MTQTRGAVSLQVRDPKSEAKVPGNGKPTGKRKSLKRPMARFTPRRDPGNPS